MGNRARRERILRMRNLPLLIGLVVTWVALWHEISPLSVVTGVLVALFAMRLFYLPPVPIARRFNVWWAFRYVAYFVLALGSRRRCRWRGCACGPGDPPKTSTRLAVQLRTESDFILTMVGLTASLIPGSLVAEVDRYDSILYLHVLNTPTVRQIREARAAALRIEELLIRAIGSTRDVEALG